jgi:hypothetical protein
MGKLRRIAERGDRLSIAERIMRRLTENMRLRRHERCE